MILVLIIFAGSIFLNKENTPKIMILKIEALIEKSFVWSLKKWKLDLQKKYHLES